MKYLLVTICMVVSSTVLLAQKTEHISFDVKTGDSYVESVTPIKDQGAVVEIRHLKPLGVDLVFYDMNMDKKWTYSFSKDDLHMITNAKYPAKQLLNSMNSYVIYANNEILFLNDLEEENDQGFTVCTITLDGKSDKKSAYKYGCGTVIRSGDEIYLYYPGSEWDKPKPNYMLRVVDPETATIGGDITLHVPDLKSGKWSYAGCDNGVLYLYGIEESSEKNNKANGFDVVVAPVTLAGAAVQPFACNVRLDTYYPSAESQGSQAVYVKLDTFSHAIYTYCHMANTISYEWVAANKCKGIYIQKFDLQGNKEWSKQYTNDDIAGVNSQFKSSGQPIGYNSYLNIDDSTHNIVLVRQELGDGKSNNNARCFLFDNDGNLKKAFMAEDQSVQWVPDYEIGTSSFFTCYPYKQGDPSYLEKLHQLYAQFPQGKDRPAAKVLNLGSKYWVEVKDMNKKTFDIYGL